MFYGWWVVLAAAVGLFWGAPITVFSFSVFLKPLMRDFHAGRGQISLGYTLGAIAGALSAPTVGWLLDRYGARQVILPATAMFGCVLLLAKTVSASIWQFYLFYVSLGLLVHGVGPVPYGSVISRWFDRHRGLALGLMMFGIGSGAIVMPFVAQHLITSLGWRNAYAILGSAVLLISIPTVAAFLKEKPQDLALLPDGALPVDSRPSTETTVPSLSAHEAWRSRTFWLMVSAFFLVSASVQGCVLHMAAMLTDRGLSIQTAALGSSLLGAALLIGRVATGYLLDRFFAPRLAAVFFGGAALGIGLLWIGNSTATVLVGAFLVGMGLGAEVDIIAYLVGRYFGLRFFGEIYGLAFGAFLLAGALGPLVMGGGFDLTGSYSTVLAAFFISTSIAALLVTKLGPYRYQPRQAEENKQILLAKPEERPCSS
ncbi:MAG: MFS transporter [Silvibacterium sp.]|jgi:MFS family permease